MSILIATLGASWQIIPELFAFASPTQLPLFAHHPLAENFHRQSLPLTPTPITQIWIVTTDAAVARASLEACTAWAAALPSPPSIRSFQLLDSQDLHSQEDCRRMAELIHRVVLHASATDPHLLLSLAGGFKTMSAELQNAAQFFGATALLHVISSPAAGPVSQELAAHSMLAPLPPHLATCLTPIIVRSPLSPSALSVWPPLSLAEFPLIDGPQSPPPLLLTQIEARLASASSLYAALPASSAPWHALLRDSFPILHSLHPATLHKLFSWQLPRDAAALAPFLAALPKVQLRHQLDELLDLNALIETAATLLPSIHDAASRFNVDFEDFLASLDRAVAQADIPALLALAPQPARLNQAFPGIPPPLPLAAFVSAFAARPALLLDFLRAAKLELRHLQGPALLCHASPLRHALSLLKAQQHQDLVLHSNLLLSPAAFSQLAFPIPSLLHVLSQELPSSTQLVFAPPPHSSGLSLLDAELALKIHHHRWPLAQRLHALEVPLAQAPFLAPLRPALLRHALPLHLLLPDLSPHRYAQALLLAPARCSLHSASSQHLAGLPLAHPLLLRQPVLSAPIPLVSHSLPQSTTILDHSSHSPHFSHWNSPSQPSSLLALLLTLASSFRLADPSLRTLMQADAFLAQALHLLPSLPPQH